MAARAHGLPLWKLPRIEAAWPQSTLLLNASLAARGTELQGDDSRLRCARASLAAGLRLTTAAIGGSITAGSSYGTGSAGASLCAPSSRTAQPGRCTGAAVH